jgi:DNA polymerase-3 subunit gamma/tau
VADTPDEPDETPYQSLYRRFRPSTFGEVRGQDHVVLALRNAVREQRVGHAYLFSGPRGTGKTSTARILAKALNCTDLHDGEPCGVCASCVEIAKGTSLDVHELDAASNNGVEAMRDLVSRAALGTPGRQKVYIVDEVHMLSTPASNALLKTLEEPPAHVIFVLATTDPQKVLPTIRSRTQHFEFRLLGPETLAELLSEVRSQAHLDVPDEALDMAVRRGRGSARDALSVLDQVAASDTVEDDLPELDEVVEALAERDVARALVAVAHLASAGFSPQQLAGDLVDHLRQGFLALVAPDVVGVSGSERDALSSQAERVGLATLVRAMEVLGLAQISMRDAPDPRVALEVALVRLAHPGADDSPAALLARIERLESGPRSAPVPETSARVTPPAPAAAAARPTGSGPSPADRARQAPAPEPAAPTAAAPAPAPAPAPEPVAPVAEAAGSAPAKGGTRKTLGAVRRESAPHPDPAPPPARSSSPDPTPPTAAPTPAPAAGTTTGDAGPLPSRDELVQAWGDHVIGRLRPKAKALFQAGRFVGVEGDKAVFGLPNEIHRGRCEDVRGEVESALGEHFGRPVGLVLVVDATPAVGDGPSPTGSAAPPRRTGPAGPSPAGPEPDADVGPTGSSDPAPPVPRPEPDLGPEDLEDLSAFDESELGEVASFDNSPESRVLKAFPGAEEVG